MVEELLVYTVFANKRQAEKICVMLIEHRLAACANILGSAKSIYRWAGRVERATETPAVLKTTRRDFPTLERMIRKNHSYTNPAIVAIEITTGSAKYLAWLNHSVRK